MTHAYLVAHIGREVAKHSGAVIARRKKVAWSSVVVCALIGVPLAYWTYALNRDDFRWLSVLPGVIAGLLLIASLGLIINPDSPATPEETSERGPADDISPLPAA